MSLHNIVHFGFIIHIFTKYIMGTLLLFIVYINIVISISNHKHLKLMKKKKISRTYRRRLSLLMDSFVDPRISDDYFYAVLYVGSPISQRVEMALDTGSGLPYFACSSTCTHCGKHDDEPYISENSTSFNWISCKHSLCGGGRCKESVCEWTQRYVDKSSISAAVGSDLFSFYQYPFLPIDFYKDTYQNSNISNIHSLKNEKKLRLVFGCSEHEANTIYRQGADGVMGLSMHHRSFVDQLFSSNDKNIDLGNKQFAHCFGHKTGGILLFGSNEINDLMNKYKIKPVWTPFITSNSGHGWYRVKTVGFKVQLSKNAAAAAVDNDEGIEVKYSSNLNSGYHGSVIDTGSSTLSMPRRPSQDIMSAILKILHSQINANEDSFKWVKDNTKNYDFFLEWNGKKNFDDADWQRLNEKYMAHFPDIVMLWNAESENHKALQFTISVERYLLFKKPHICLDLFGDTPSILVGSNVMVNKFMIYDRENMKLGVANIDCDELVTQSGNGPNDNDNDNEQTFEIETNEIVQSPIVDVIEGNGMKENEEEEEEIAKDPVFMIHSNHFNEIYWIYFIILIVSSICAFFVYFNCLKRDKNERSNVRYSPVNTIEPESEFDEKKIYNHRRKKSVSSYMNGINVNMDNMISMTAPTQSFTSTQHKKQIANNDKI